MSAPTIEQIAEEMKAATGRFDGARQELKEAHTEITAKMSEQKTVISQELKEAVDKALADIHTKYSGMSGELLQLEQKLAGVSNNDNAPQVKSWGQQFIEADKFKGIAENGSSFSGNVKVEVKAIDSVAAGGLITTTYRDNELVNLLRERMTVADLLRSINVNTSSVDYVVQTLRTNAAAPVAESAVKPYSDYAWGSATAVIRVLAHLAKITRQALDDAPRLVGEIDSEMRYGLQYVKDRQYLYGTGVGQNILGIMPQATAFARPAGFGQMTASTKIDVLRVAMLQNAIAMLPADGLVLNDIDWTDIELTKTTDGAYLFANPTGTVGARMWGLGVVTTPAMVAGDFLAGNFQMGATEYRRQGIEVLISTENVDDFETNRATMRAEERVGLAVKRPLAFTKGTFSTARTALNAV